MYNRARLTYLFRKHSFINAYAVFQYQPMFDIISPAIVVIDEYHFHSIMSNLYSQLGYPTEEFKTLQLIVLEVLSAVVFCLVYVGPLSPRN